MKTKAVIWLLSIAAVLAWTGMASAQSAPVTPKVQLPNGEAVCDVPEVVGTDALGRKYFHPGEAELRSARVVTVSLSDGNGKTFSTGSA